MNAYYYQKTLVYFIDTLQHLGLVNSKHNYNNTDLYSDTGKFVMRYIVGNQ